MIDPTAVVVSPFRRADLRLSLAEIASRKWGVAILLLNAMLCLISVVYGLDYLYPRPSRLLVYHVATVVWVAGLGAMFSLSFTGRNEDHRLGPVLDRLGPWLCYLQLFLTLFFNLTTRLALVAITVVAVLAFCLDRWRPSAAFAGALAGGFVTFIVAIVLIPIDRGGADMLPYINHAVDAFLAGRNPYAEDFSALGKNPFFYMPLQWLIYLPPWVIGVDARVVNVLSAAAIVALVEVAARRDLVSGSLRAGVYPLLLSPLAFPMMHSGQVFAYWLCTLGFGLLALEGRWTGAAAIAGLAIGIRPTAALPAVALFVGLLGHVPRVVWLRSAAVGVVVVSAGLLPFIVSYPDALNVMLVDGPKRALAVAHAVQDPLPQIAASAIMDHFGLDRFDVWIETCVAVAFLPVAWLAARRGIQHLLCAAGVMYAATIAFNPYLHRYYYVAGLLLFAIGISAGRFDDRVIASVGAGEARETEMRGSRRRTRLRKVIGGGNPVNSPRPEG